MHPRASAIHRHHEHVMPQGAHSTHAVLAFLKAPPLPLYQMQRALAHEANLRQRVAIVLQLLPRKQQLLSLHWDVRCLHDAGAYVMDLVHGELYTELDHGDFVQCRDEYCHAGISLGSLRSNTTALDSVRS